MDGLKDAVNDTSLIDTEVDFMIACIDSKTTNVQGLIEIYEQYPRLLNCQLGDVLRRCLDSQSDLIFAA